MPVKMTTPEPVKSDLRFSTRVDFFFTPEDATAFIAAKEVEGYSPSTSTLATCGPYAGLYGVHWNDRKEGLCA